MSTATNGRARECPCYLHRYPPMPLRNAYPCICECEVPHEADVRYSPPGERSQP